MTRFFLIVNFIIYLSSSVYAQIPDGYYDSAKDLKGLELKKALHKIIRGHKQFYYTKGSPNVWEILKESDRDTANPNNVILIYTGKSVSSNPNKGKTWNREHVWAKSHGDFGTKIGTGTDVHAIRPCHPKVNSARSNYDFAEGGTSYLLPSTGEDTGCKVTTDSWEPRDEVKGDIARMIFYMATRYDGDYETDTEEVVELDLQIVDYVNSSPYPKKPPLHGKLSDLLKWHKQDPVDSMEIRRNEVIFKYQKNRNPFIDHPEYVNLIYDNWHATSIDEPVQMANVYIVKAYPNPAKNYVIVEFRNDMQTNKKLTLQILDSTGRERINMKTNSNMNLINCSKLPGGLYFLKVFDNKKVLSKQKIIIN